MVPFPANLVFLLSNALLEQYLEAPLKVQQKEAKACTVLPTGSPLSGAIPPTRPRALWNISHRGHIYISHCCRCQGWGGTVSRNTHSAYRMTDQCGSQAPSVTSPAAGMTGGEKGIGPIYARGPTQPRTRRCRTLHPSNGMKCHERHTSHKSERSRSPATVNYLSAELPAAAGAHPGNPLPPLPNDGAFLIRPRPPFWCLRYTASKQQ